MDLFKCFLLYFLLFNFLNRVKQTVRVDWTPEFRKNSMYKTIPLKRWYVVYVNRAVRETNEFVTMVINAARGMQFEIAMPRL